MTYNYIATHLENWTIHRSIESLWRIASAKDWLTPTEELGYASEMSLDRIAELSQKAAQLAGVKS